MKKNVLILMLILLSLSFIACPVVDVVEDPEINNPGENDSDQDEFKQIVIGGDSIYVLKTDGSLWVNGYNNLGQLGLDDTQIRSTPTKVLENVKYVSAAVGHSMVIKDDNSLWASGDNSIGQFGNGTTTSTLTYIKIRDNVKQVSCSDYHTLIIDSDDKLLTAGKNTHGQLGDNTTTNNSLFDFVDTDGKTVVDIDSEELTSLYLTSDNELYGFGDNSYGQLAQAKADNVENRQLIPVLLASNVIDFSVGTDHVMYVDTNDVLWGVGRNENGQIGESVNLDRDNYTPYNAMSNVKSVSAGYHYTMAIKNDDSLWAVGNDSYSKQGDGNSNESTNYSFYEVTDSGFIKLDSNNDVEEEYDFNGAKIIYTGNHNTIVKTVDDEVFIAGSNSYGQLGQSTTDDNPHGLWSKLEFNEVSL
ncbi:MAG: RCC1 domain-containing protein [Pleomorphochaeta sp.]